MHHFQLTFFDLGALYLLEILLQEVQTDVELSIHDLIHLGISSGNVSTIDILLSLELASSLLGSLVCPSVSCCIHVLGLHVAVTAGWDGDPLGKLTQGLLVPLGSTSRVTGGVVVEVVVVAIVVVGISGITTTSLSQLQLMLIGLQQVY